jgi:pilus assembly protein CpaF
MKFLDHPALQIIRPLMLDPAVTEIMINGPRQVYVERKGVMELVPIEFSGEPQLNQLISALLQSSGRDVSSATPFADFSLPDGSRGNVTIAPISLIGPVVTIRKFTKALAKVEDLIAAGTLSRRMARLLGAAVKGRANILFCGASGTGKTTTLAILARHIPEGERIITIEDTAEIHLPQAHVVRLECRHPNLEGKGGITLSQLVRNSLRMRPTRIIVGEVRGEEALDMIQAIATGHQGCLAVLHASSPADAISRLEMMLLSRGLLLPLWAIHRQIAAAIDLIVQHEMLPDGSRKITFITELAGVEGDRVVLRDLFEYRRRGAEAAVAGPAGPAGGQWVCSGVRPRFLDKCEKLGFTLAPDTFAAGAE